MKTDSEKIISEIDLTIEKLKTLREHFEQAGESMDGWRTCPDLAFQPRLHFFRRSVDDGLDPKIAARALDAEWTRRGGDWESKATPLPFPLHMILHGAEPGPPPAEEVVL